MRPEKVSIVLLDNHKLLRAGLRALISGFDDFKISAEGGFDQALSLVGKYHPDVVLIDLVNTDIHSEDIISSIIKTDANTSILALGNRSDDNIIWHALKQGVLGCLLYDSEPNEIYQAVSALADGGSFIPPLVGRKIIQAYKLKERPQKTILSSQQIVVLKLMSQGFSNLEIASQLVISKRTVEMHAYKIFKRLEVNSRTQAIQKALHEGILDMSDIN